MRKLIPSMLVAWAPHVWVQPLAECLAAWEVCSVQRFRAARRAVSPTQGTLSFQPPAAGAHRGALAEPSQRKIRESAGTARPDME